MDRKQFLLGAPAALALAVLGAGSCAAVPIDAASASKDGLLLDAHAGSQARIYFCEKEVSFRTVKAYVPLEPGVASSGTQRSVPG